ncbi:invasion associated locus B family protein [Aestuariivirga sp.]|uniref:invasion associated locus B family protein n=1 Tax=Aestuariivirga sp. TaxID=2650926 RepID=UPI0025C5310B|nr:invasion associated locus B family protein [Aestuariivirga sp.]MCA3554872.1 invasion associated locus B family protein [Aestuariivirga sp.]
MRITLKPSRLLALTSLGIALSLGLSGAASAQNTAVQKQDQQAPAGGQQPQFGPRASKAAQPGQPQAPKIDLIAENGQWKVQCETVPATEGQPGGRQCGMVQVTTSEKNPKASLTLVIVSTQQNGKPLYNMRVIAPIGVFLPTGVALEIDGNAVGRVPFTRCMPQICMAFAEASPDTLAKLKKGKAANFIIYEAPGIGLPMKLSLDGFSASLAALDKASSGG